MSGIVLSTFLILVHLIISEADTIIMPCYSWRTRVHINNLSEVHTLQSLCSYHLTNLPIWDVSTVQISTEISIRIIQVFNAQRSTLSAIV